MTAAQAREQAEKALMENTNGTYSKIMMKIETQTKQGLFSTMFYDKIPKEVIELLKKEGYELKIYEDNIRGEDSCKISW